MVSSISLSRRSPEHFCKFCRVDLFIYVFQCSEVEMLIPSFCCNTVAAGTVPSPAISIEYVDITLTASNLMGFKGDLSTRTTMRQRTRRCACANIGPFLARIMPVNFPSPGEISTEVSTKWKWNRNSSINRFSVGDLFVEFLQICINQSPSSGEFSRVKAFLDRVICAHVIKTIG